MLKRTGISIDKMTYFYVATQSFPIYRSFIRILNKKKVQT